MRLILLFLLLCNFSFSQYLPDSLLPITAPKTIKPEGGIITMGNYNNYVEAQFPGGIIALRKYLKDNIIVPEDFQLNFADTCVKVYVQFTVRETGELDDIFIIRSFSKSIDMDVIRVFSNMPNWIPGLKGGEVNPTICRCPVNFCVKD